MVGVSLTKLKFSSRIPLFPPPSFSRSLVMLESKSTGVSQDDTKVVDHGFNTLAPVHS